MGNLRFSHTTRPTVLQRRPFRCLIWITVLWLTGTKLPAQPSAAQDYEVKAGFLVKFTQYTTWPRETFANGETPMVIGVADGESLFRRLNLEAKNLTGSRRVEVRRLKTVEEGARCHVVYIGKDEIPNEGKWLEALQGKPILTVGESEKAIEYGAVMRFVIQDSHVRFEANLNAAEKNRLVLNPRMLAVASKVYKSRKGTSGT